MGLFSHCLFHDHSSFGKVCLDRIDLDCEAFSSSSLTSDCHEWRSETWQILAAQVVAICCQLVASTIAIMCYCCVLPMSLLGRGTSRRFGGLLSSYMVMAILSFSTWICTITSVARNNALQMSFWRVRRKAMLEARGSKYEDAKWYAFENGACHILTAWSLVFMMFSLAIALGNVWMKRSGRSSKYRASGKSALVCPAVVACLTLGMYDSTRSPSCAPKKCLAC